MNTKSLIAAAALTLVAAAASAQTVDSFWHLLPTNQPSELTREAVLAELVRARQAGPVRGADAIVGVPVQATATAATQTREQVRAELGTAQVDSASNGFGFITPVPASTRSRDEVRAEVMASRRDKSNRTGY